MGEFDDVLAMEPGDEWDDYDAGREPQPDSTAPPVVAQLALPGGAVDLRGELPEEVLDALSDLRSSSDSVTEGQPLSSVTVEAIGGGSQIAGLTDATGPLSPSELLDSLIDALVVIIESTARALAPLRAAQVELRPPDGEPFSVLIASSDESHRHGVVAQLLQAGAGFLSGDLTVLIEGSRTTLGWPAPLSEGSSAGSPGGGAGRRLGSAMGDVARHGSPGAVVFVDGADDDLALPVQLRRLDSTDGCVRLMRQVVAAHGLGGESFDAVAALSAGVSFWHVPESDPVVIGELIEAVSPRPGRELVVTHQVPDSSVRFARFDEGGVLVDDSSTAVLRLEADEVDALESFALVGRRPPIHEAALDRLVGQGVELPAAPSSRRGPKPPVPPVESFGLPGSPGGRVASELWRQEPGRRRGRQVVPVTAAVAQAAERGVLTPEPPTGDELARHLAAVRARAEELRRVGAEAARTLRSHDIEPLLIGAVVHDNDSVVPSGFVDGSTVDVLVGSDQVVASIDALLEVDYERTDDEAAVARDDPSVAACLESPEGAPLRILDRLAVGPFGELVDHDDFRRRATKVWIGGEWCSALHPTDRFICACVDLSLHPESATIQELRNVAMTAPRSAASMSAALEASERWGATGGMLAALGQASSRMPGIPALSGDRTSPRARSRRRR